MTDTEALGRVLEVAAPAEDAMTLVKRNGRLLLSLPTDREAARRTLRLYQPQRRAATILAKVLDIMIGMGCSRLFLPEFSNSIERHMADPPMPEVIKGTCGVMFGNPEHRVRRVIASFRTSGGWEVAKVAFGSEGWDVVRGEVAALKSLPQNTPGVPTLLGIHRSDGISLMRMPYFQGRVLRRGDSADAVALLASWKLIAQPMAITEFPEWTIIETALCRIERGREVLRRISRMQLQPVIRHGDYARWNLLRLRDGSLMVIDWEWGVANGMPGIDLVHFFAQDARLVDRMSPNEVIRNVETSLRRSDSRAYLEETGWGTDIRAAILVSLAFTYGTGHQANFDVLAAALDLE